MLRMFEQHWVMAMKIHYCAINIKISNTETVRRVARKSKAKEVRRDLPNPTIVQKMSKF